LATHLRRPEQQLWNATLVDTVCQSFPPPADAGERGQIWCCEELRPDFLGAQWLPARSLLALLLAAEAQQTVAIVRIRLQP
jgi:hypothetical protein